jgi:hypothetical protein
MLPINIYIYWYGTVDSMVDIVYIPVTIEFVMVAVNAVKFAVSFPVSVNAEGVFEP